MSLRLRPVLAVLALVFLALTAAVPARAQDKVWIQIEALPNQAKATERAEAYAGAFPETEGYKLRSGWFGIVLGPYGVAEGAAQLNGLKRENLIPADSYITDGAEFRERFWPVAGAAPSPAPEPAAQPEAVAPAVPAAPAVVEEPEETVREARASEAALTEDDRKLLQTALQWFGFYAGGIDGAIGPGSRKSMAAWQESLGLEPTGVLTTRQRATLVANYQAEVAEFGFAPVTEAEAGIEVTLPLALVEFDHYEPPFVHFREKSGSGLSIVLISQPGDLGAFYGLYDILQTLDAMPLTGERSRTEKEFRLRGTSATRDSHAAARFERGFIKGWMLLSTPASADRDARILTVLEQSFRGVGDIALDPGLVPLDQAARRGLLAGLDVRKPKFSRSGFYIGPEGAVLTTVSAVEGCGRITIERDQEAVVTLTDATSGLAVLTPSRPLSPRAVAAFQLAPDRVGTEVAVAGYSYEDRLPAPVLTYGTLEDVTGLDGEPGVKRLALSALPGDAGGPVLDPTGAVLGMLLPAPEGGDRVLPEGVSFAAASARIAGVLSAGGIALTQASGGGALPPEDLSKRATDMTVLVSCWD
ncbi:serine protease [Rhodobacter sp. Har01]|uniref:serine protease n=1 Tax=Rhodobacter sp. Har01 TaxID=2883999 RepID=UPI001D061BBA|nr:serine protease [Rhodobacter sp. Har01]MCB6178717.1 serine protease [Rhodobacter sp. Har01]